MVDPTPTYAWLEDDDVMKAPDLLGILQDFVKHPGWEMISRILDAQAQLRLNRLVTNPLKSLDAALEQEYEKGEAAQLLTLRGLPTVLIEELQNAIKDMQANAPRADPDDSSSSQHAS